MKLINEFFETARERYAINLKRMAGLPREEWTQDPIYQKWRFCNVHREDDKTTIWVRENLRVHLSGVDVARAMFVFRWFNRIETGEAIKHILLDRRWDRKEAQKCLRDVSPVVTGAYMIRTPEGFSKMNGVLEMLERQLPRVEEIVGQWPSGYTLQGAWSDFVEKIPMGPFMAYEVISDLRWTDLLYSAPDIMTWANAGPGCAHGLGRVVYGDSRHYHRHSPEDQQEMNSFMCEILSMSRDSQFWPQDWKPWEMREVEHWCCEFDKYRRGMIGIRLKRKF